MEERLKEKKIRILPQIFAIILLVIEIMHLLLISQFMGSGNIDLGYLNYKPAIPTSFTYFLIWLSMDVLTLLNVVMLFYWDNSKGHKIGYYLILLTRTFLDQQLFKSTIILFEWSFFIILIIREIPHFHRKRRIAVLYYNLNKITKIIPPMVLLFIIIPIVPVLKNYEQPENRYELYYGGETYAERKQIYEDYYYTTGGRYKEIIKAYNGLPVDEDRVQSQLDDILIGESDFAMQFAVRLLYIDNNTHVLEPDFRETVHNTIKDARYWYNEPGDPVTIFWTENHQLAYHSSHYLAAQFFLEANFTNSNKSGQEHFDFIEPILDRFLTWKGQYGFTEWHSGTYINFDIISLLNLVDFSENTTIATKAAMLLDLILFDFANNFYKEGYYVTQGRIYGGSRVGTDENHLASRDNIAEFAWLALGVGAHTVNEVGNSVGCLLTSDKYIPPTILEEIAEDCKEYNEHREASGWNIDDAELLGLGKDEESLMYFWSAAAFMHEYAIEEIFDLVDKYEIDPMSFIGPGIPDIMKVSSFLRGITLPELAYEMRDITHGIAMEKVNTYTYRTPYYQLSGAQDYHKGYGGIQEQIWQASLSKDAYIFTNSPGGFDFKGGAFIGGWMPRGTFYKNFGIIQYDHESYTLESMISTGALSRFQNYLMGNRPKNHAYFPRWAFDETLDIGNWHLGMVEDSYVALYSSNPTYWANDYELVAIGNSNCWIVELGSIEEYGSFDNFIQEISSSSVSITKLKLGFDVEYESPSQGLTTVNWDDNFIVNGSIIPLNTNMRWDNQYSQTPYGSLLTEIEYEGTILHLDFEIANRTIIS